MPEQSPISPPYKTACFLKKHGMLDKASYSGLVAMATTNTTSKKDARQTNDAEDLSTIKVEHLSLDDNNQTVAMAERNITSKKDSRQTNNVEDTIKTEHPLDISQETGNQK